MKREKNIRKIEQKNMERLTQTGSQKEVFFQSRLHVIKSTVINFAVCARITRLSIQGIGSEVLRKLKIRTFIFLHWIRITSLDFPFPSQRNFPKYKVILKTEVEKQRGKQNILTLVFALKYCKEPRVQVNAKV